jgi:Xaa-Pro aminopeptidase
VQNETQTGLRTKNISCTEPHHMGLDTHDYGILTEPMQAMVFTVEPGIYIPAEGFGIRLEDDVVISNRRTLQLDAQHPNVDEIESLMNK